MEILILLRIISFYHKHIFTANILYFGIEIFYPTFYVPIYFPLIITCCVYDFFSILNFTYKKSEKNT